MLAIRFQLLLMSNQGIGSKKDYVKALYFYSSNASLITRQEDMFMTISKACHLHHFFLTFYVDTQYESVSIATRSVLSIFN